MIDQISKIIVPDDEEQMQNDLYNSIWCSVKLMTDTPHGLMLSTRCFPKLVTAVLARVEHGDLVFRDGASYHMPEFDDVFPPEHDYRSISMYRESDASGLRPRRKTRKVERARLMWIFVQTFPNLHGHLDIGLLSIDGLERYLRQSGSVNHEL